MNMDAIPTWAFFVGTVLLVMITVEGGYRLGRFSHRASGDKEESSAGAAAAAVLGLLAFMLAFTFGIVSDRYYARVGLVRDEANALRTTYLRSAFLPETDRAEARGLLGQYLEGRLSAAESGNLERVTQARSEAERIQRHLWNTAVANARKDMNSDVAALYIESINQMIDLHGMRIAVGVQARIPMNIWIVLFTLAFLGLLTMGYSTAVAGSKRSKATAFLVVSFAMVMAMIASLDRPGGFLKVAQQPLIDLQGAIAAGRLDEDLGEPLAPAGANVKPPQKEGQVP